MNFRKITSSSGLISFGNTGARLSDPRATYFKILSALKEFRKNNKSWEIYDQKSFGKLLGDLEIFSIKTDNKVTSDKDVRVKTGFISQLGFTNKNRFISSAGNELLENSNSLEKNEYEISKESYTYLKQFLKYQQSNFEILPLLSLIYSILEFNNELPTDFVTYIWSGSRSKNDLLKNIKKFKYNYSYRDTVYQSIQHSENSKIAEANVNLFLSKFTLSNKIKLNELLYSILPHGKGNTFKNKSINLFNDLYLYWQNILNWNYEKKEEYIKAKLISRYKDISSKKPGDYQFAFFGINIINNSSDWIQIIKFFENTPLISSVDDKSFIINFHIIYMFIKKLSVCEEYRDLNIRHLKLLDIFIFDNDKIKLDLVFEYLFKSVKDDLIKTKPLPIEDYIKKLENSQNSIGEIYDFLDINYNDLSKQIESDFPEVRKIGLRNFTLLKKEERFLELVKTVFTIENIIQIFEKIYPRNDEVIRKQIKEWYQDYDATIPALFEYLLVISFYWLSSRQIKISDILKMNLDANLLPKTHTAGGQADFIFNINNKDFLIEATLSEKDGQRKMEAEPVPRHLAKHILEINLNSIAIFVAGELDPNNLVILRNYKFSTWYNSDGKTVEKMNILPLSISNMICLLKEKKDFNIIENDFENLLNSATKDGYNWYNNEVNTRFSC